MDLENTNGGSMGVSGKRVEQACYSGVHAKGSYTYKQFVEDVGIQQPNKGIDTGLLDDLVEVAGTMVGRDWHEFWCGVLIEDAERVAGVNQNPAVEINENDLVRAISVLRTRGITGELAVGLMWNLLEDHDLSGEEYDWVEMANEATSLVDTTEAPVVEIEPVEEVVESREDDVWLDSMLALIEDGVPIDLATKALVETRPMMPVEVE